MVPRASHVPLDMSPSLSIAGGIFTFRRMRLEALGYQVQLTAATLVQLVQLDQRIEQVLDPFAQQLSLLRTIPGIGDRAAQVLPVSSSPRALASASITDAAVCSGDSCRPAPPDFFGPLTIPDVITHSAHPAEPHVRRIGPKTPFRGQSPTAPATPEVTNQVRLTVGIPHGRPDASWVRASSRLMPCLAAVAR
jgi:hypothetical protein